MAKDKNIKLGILVLTLLSLIIIFGKAFQFIQSLNQPLSKTLTKEYSWDSQTSINVLFKSSQISIVSFDPKEKRVVILKIPNDAYMDLPKGFGSWRVGSIFDLGQGEDPPIGSKLLKESISRLLGLPVDGVLIVKEGKDLGSFDEILETWAKSPSAPYSFLLKIGFASKIESDLTPLELLSLFKDISGVRVDKVISLDLERSNITKSKLLADSSRVLGIDIVNLDLFIRENMAPSEVVKEQKTVALFNATPHSGLAGEAARVVTNLGGDVIIIRSFSRNLPRSVVVSKEESSTTKRLSQFFAPDCLREECLLEDELIKSGRADINIVLGEDFFIRRY